MTIPALARGTLSAFKRRGLALLVAAVLPFLASHVVVMTARSVGMPERLALDLLHGVLVLAYLGAVLKIVDGEAKGLVRFGFAVPRLVWPGGVVVLKVWVVIVAFGLPAALILHPIVEGIEAAQAGREGFLYFPAAMLPEFIMTTLIGVVWAVASAKIGSSESVGEAP